MASIKYDADYSEANVTALLLVLARVRAYSTLPGPRPSVFFPFGAGIGLRKFLRSGLLPGDRFTSPRWDVAQNCRASPNGGG